MSTGDATDQGSLPAQPPAASHMRWWVKAVIGGAGGLALALLFLINQKFMMGDGNEAALGAILLSGAVVLVGMLLGAVVPENAPFKIFIYGLMAPSLLSNVVAQSGGSGSPGANIVAPSLPPLALPAPAPQQSSFGPRWNFDEARIILAAETKPGVRKVAPHEVGNSLRSGALRLLGNDGPPNRFAYVVGTTDSRADALTFAAYLNAAIPQADRVGGVQVLTSGEKSRHVVAVGGLMTLKDAHLVRSYTLRALAQTNPQLVPYLMNGQVMDGSELFN